MYWQDTGVVKFSKGRQYSDKQERDLDGIDPRSTFIRADAPPFPSHPRDITVPENGCEQKCRDQCDAKGIKSHPGTNCKGQRQVGVQPLQYWCAFIE